MGELILTILGIATLLGFAALMVLTGMALIALFAGSDEDFYPQKDNGGLDESK